jgi:hypothetical protein
LRSTAARDVNEHVFLTADDAASTGLFEKGASVDAEARGRASAWRTKLEYTPA